MPEEQYRKSWEEEPRLLSLDQLDELTSGDGVYYIPQETALCPGISGEWPSVIPHPTNKKGRLVKRQAKQRGQA